MIAWFAPVALAVDVKLCADLETQFSDSYPEASPVYDDYFNSNTTPEPLRGAQWCITPSGGAESCAFAASEGADRGCATFSMASFVGHQVKIKSRARVTRGGAGFNDLLVVAGSPASPPYDPYSLTLESSFYVAPNQTTYWWHLVNLPIHWDHLALMGWALHHRDGGVAGEEFWHFPEADRGFHCDLDEDGQDADECGGPDTQEHDSVWCTSDNRYTVMHEFGHYILRKRNELHGSANTNDGDMEDCFYDDGDPLTDPRGHEFQQKEMVNNALHEGFANFYAAVTFNDQTETDCRFMYFARQNYDLDNDDDPILGSTGPAQGNSINCEGKPDVLPGGGTLESGDAIHSAITASDYLYDSNIGLGCGTVLANRGTEYDFLRFWWDLTTDSANDWTFVDVVNVLDRTNPHLWIGGTNDSDPNGSGNPPDLLPTEKVEAALDQAVIDNVITSAMRQQWLDESAHHGTDR